MTRRRIGKIVIPMSLVHGVLAILLLGLITLGVTAAFKTKAQEIVDNRETVKEYQSNIEDQASFVTDYMMAKYLDENRLLVGTNPPSFANEKVFTMTMPKKAYSNIYQRNFIGADYVNGGWDYDGKEFEEACKAVGISVESARYEIESGAFRRMTDPTFRENGKVLGALETPFEYDIEYNSGDEISLLAPYFTSGEISGSVLTEDVLPVRGLFTKNAQIKALSRPTLSPMELRTLSTNELAENEETIWKFYDQYVLSHYTKGSDVVPTAKEAAAWLVKPCDENDDMSINIWRMNMIERVTAVFSAYDYNWEVYAPNNMDAVEYFLNEGHQGYCIHFATAGALILREMGIPARFAGGYIVNGAKFKYSASDEAYKQDVYDRDAHAWVEVYLNHIGWVPVECTPSYTTKDESLTTGQESKELLGRPSEVLIRESSYYKNAWHR